MPKWDKAVALRIIGPIRFTGATRVCTSSCFVFLLACRYYFRVTFASCFRSRKLELLKPSAAQRAAQHRKLSPSVECAEASLSHIKQPEPRLRGASKLVQKALSAVQKITSLVRENLLSNQRGEPQKTLSQRPFTGSGLRVTNHLSKDAFRF